MSNRFKVFAATIAILLLLSACGSESDSSLIAVAKSADEYVGENYEDVLNELSASGFINVETEVLDDLILGFITKDGEVESVSINGNAKFSKGTKFAPDTTVIVTYHTFPETSGDNSDLNNDNTTDAETNTVQKDSESVSYSTNSKATVKNGNSGVYAYKTIGGMHDNYWIIDFDEKYVYWFTDGNGELTCDRVAMVSGSLNDVLIITYHDGDSEWSYGLHFKWKNQPDTLIMQDNNGFEYEYYTTNLEKALLLRENRNIVDF